MQVYRALRQMVTAVIEIDDALTQLKIVTGATDSQMTQFLTKSISLAKELGQSITDVLGSIETFSRLGYNLEDSSVLAKYTAMLANVAAVDTDEATTGMTSIIKGYNLKVDEAEHVADVLVQVGQKYAVSAGEMMEAYEKSGAALNATNTSFEKSAGLIAAANASVQNASTVGTALKTVSARIRGAVSDLEELGEDTDELAEGFSKYAAEIKALTGFDIMVEGTTDTYKDIYDIFEGIAQVWDRLSDTQQARVAEILGGTRQLQVISSIIGNWGDAAGAYADAMDAAGVATQANTAYMDSITGHIQVFKATFQELGQNLIDSDFVKGIVDFGTAVLNILNGVATVSYTHLGDSRISLTIPKDEYTLRFNRDNRFLMDDCASPNVLAYRLTKPFKLGSGSGEGGVLSLVLQECNTEDTDNFELHIANYYDYFPRRGEAKEPIGPTEEETEECPGKKVWL